MRDRWYSDNRDIVKWATLTHIAKEHRLQTILQVPYLQSESFHPHFSFDGKPFPISNKVWKFFRSIHNVKGLGPEVGVSINVVAEIFEPLDRKTYITKVKNEIMRSRRPLLLFLDPDTGLEPAKSNPKHTTIKEIKKLWSALKPGEWIVLYQHARRTSTWIEEVKRQLRDICEKRNVYVSHSKDIGQDVAFFCIQAI